MKEYIKSNSIPVDSYLETKIDLLFQDILQTDDKELEDLSDLRSKIDAQTSARVLPFHCPIKAYSSIERSLWDFNIQEIKMLLSQGENVKNFLVTDDGIKRYRCSSKEKMKKMELLIKLYDEQVDRLLESEKNKGHIITPKLFYIDNESKRKIVIQNLDSIGRNFVDAGSEFVFGAPTSNQLGNILFSTNKERKTIDSLASRFIDMITYYSTLDELLKNPKNPPSINRLVKK